MKNKPYTYLIGWTLHNKWYYGVRYAKNCHPDDLWVKYRTSGKYVTDFVTQYGDPDVVQVRKTFENVNDARGWEEKVLRRMIVIKDQKWLNKTNSRSIDPSTHPRGENHWATNNPEYSRRISQFGPMSKKETRLKITGKNHYTKKDNYDNSNHTMKRPEIVAKVKIAVSGDNHYTRRPDYDNGNHYAKRPEAKLKRAEMNKMLFTGYKHKLKQCKQCLKEIPANNYPQHIRKCIHIN